LKLGDVKKKVESKLKQELKKVITPICIREFSTLVGKVILVETLEKESSRVIRNHGGGSPIGKVKPQSQSS